jgi:hypothetical protein
MVVRTVKGQGAEYVPSAPPQTGDVKDLRDWMQNELRNIADTLTEGRSRWLRLDVLPAAPTRPVEGMICKFAANAVSAGSLKGVWEYDGAAWNKL